MRSRHRSALLRAGMLVLAPTLTTLTVSCTAESPQTSAAEQAVVNPPLPSLTLILNAKNALSIGAQTTISGDIAASGTSGTLSLDVSATQFFGNALANTVTIGTSASAAHVFGNDITNNGTIQQQTLGLDPGALPQVPVVTASTPGKTAVSLNENQSKQLCPGSYGAISLANGAILNLNGGVYQISKLTLGDNARLEPSEPVVILISGAVTTGTGSVFQPSAQSLNPMSAANIRIEVGGAVTLGDSNTVRAHLVATGKITTGKSTSVTGALAGKAITIGPQSSLNTDGVLLASSPSVPPPCNDNNACTIDQCVGGGTATAFCRNSPEPSGTSCDDGNTCNGSEVCDGAGTCQAGINAPSGTSCSDGNACNGDETCTGTGTCQSGTPPVVDDGNVCTADTCDAINGVSHVPLPDGTTCNGSGICQSGVCSAQGSIFSQDFISGVGPVAQCTAWQTFQASLTQSVYSHVSISGTFDTVGVSCDDPTSATQICQGLHTGSFVSVFCNGRTWSVDDCGGIELTADTFTCSCDFGYVARPCIDLGSNNPNWGGANTETCDGPSQNITVTCE